MIERRVLPMGYSLTALTPIHSLRTCIASLHPVLIDIPLIRLGPIGDGGYLVPDDLEGIDAVFSPGVATQSGFEWDCAERGLRVFMADRSVTAPSLAHPNFDFIRRDVGTDSDEITITMDEWVESKSGKSTGDLLLQMDIEGAEWLVLANMSSALLERCRIIVIELHRLQDLRHPESFRFMGPILERITRTHHCVHIHPNNTARFENASGVPIPTVAEFTFLRKDRAKTIGFAHLIPHPLDSDNVSGDGHPHMVLPREWRGA